MSKYQELTKRTVKSAIVASAIVGAFAIVYIGLSMYADRIAQQKTDAANLYNQDSGLVTTLRNQLDKSGEAQKRYAVLQADRNSQDFSGNIEGLKEFLRNSKTRYHFDKVNFKPQKEVASDKPELANFNYNIMLQPRVSVQFLAVSDVHVFSFLDDLRRSAPGLIRIDSLKLKRTAELSDATLVQMGTGSIPLLVDATVEFTWIHITPKDTKDSKNIVATSPAAPH